MAATAPLTTRTFHLHLWSLCLAACGPTPGSTGTSSENPVTTAVTTATTTNIQPTSTLTSISTEPASSTTGPTSEDGWHYLDEAPLSIELCGSACAEFQTGGDLTALYRCPSD